MRGCFNEVDVTRHLNWVGLTLLSFVVRGPVAAQTPRTVQLVPSELAGVVRDTTGAPLRDAEIVLPFVGKSVRTDSAGAFAVLSVAPGAHDVLFRRIGFTSVQFTWTGIEGQRTNVSITLLPLPNTLDPVRVWANESRSLGSRSTISGIVVDSAGVPVAGADVQLIGAGRSTASANDGTFEFRHVPPGTLTLRVRRLGYTPAALMVELGDDDQRAVSLRIRRLVQTLDAVTVTAESGYGASDAAWREFDLREKWRSNSGGAVSIGPKRLQEAGKMPLDFLLLSYQDAQPGRSPSRLTGLQCVLENGIQARYIPLGLYAANEVQRVEYYPAALKIAEDREYTGTVEARVNRYPQCAKNPYGGHAAYFVVWLNNAR
jgi:hypothetical protein